jgi:hypothetical protein
VNRVHVQVEYMVGALWHGFQLVLAHERDEGLRYDAVVRMRPDVGIHTSKGIYISAMTPHAWRLVARRPEPQTVVSLPHALTNTTVFPLANLSAPCHNAATEFIDNCFWSHPADSAVALAKAWYEHFYSLHRCADAVPFSPCIGVHFPHNLYRTVSNVYRSRIERVSTVVSIEKMRVRYTSIHNRYKIAALVGAEQCIELWIQSQFR